VLAMDKLFLPLIIHPPCYSCIQLILVGYHYINAANTNDINKK